MKKRFKLNWKTLLLELVVVFIGVYLAFTLNTFSENQKIGEEQDKVMGSLKKELDVIGLTFGNMASFQESKVEEWDSLRNAGDIPNFYSWRFVQPQYNYSVLEYAINTQDARIVNFELYEKLMPVYQEMQKLIFAENMMTEWSGKFRNMPPELDSTDVEYQARKADNRFSVYKFTTFADDRANIMDRLVQLSRAALVHINEYIEPEARIEMEKELIRRISGKLDVVKNDEGWKEVMGWAEKHFTHITTEEWDAFREEIIQELDATSVAEK